MNEDIKKSFEKTRVAGSIAANALEDVSNIIRPGISTDEIDKLCYEFINDHGAYSAPLFYRGFPKSSCTSVNHVVCHGIPSEKILNEGDIINVDITAYKNGWHGDTSRMFEIGEISIKANKLIETTYEAMMKAIKILNDGWTAVTKDKALSAQFEHTVGITKDGYEIFTHSKKFG